MMQNPDNPKFPFHPQSSILYCFSPLYSLCPFKIEIRAEYNLQKQK